MNLNIPFALSMESANAGPEDWIRTERDESLSNRSNKWFEGRGEGGIQAMGGSECRNHSTLVGKSVGGADSLPSNRLVAVHSSSVFNHLACVLFEGAVGGRIATFLST